MTVDMVVVDVQTLQVNGFGLILPISVVALRSITMNGRRQVVVRVGVSSGPTRSLAGTVELRRSFDLAGIIERLLDCARWPRNHDSRSSRRSIEYSPPASS